jgi:hypothetical protein
MTETPSDPSKSASTSIVVEDDPLAKLHKMSRTAGLGSSEYVAVNPISVAALLFGLASGLVIFDALFLLVPAVAVVLAVIALHQIRNSNGTQTGRGLSWLAIGLAVLFTALLGSRQIMQVFGTQADKRAIAQLVRDFGKDIAARNYDAAYDKTSPRFRERIDKKAFIEKYNGLQDNPNYGPMLSMEWNELVNFDVDARSNDTIAGSVAIITVKTRGETGEREGKDRREIRFRKRGDAWQVDDMPEFFPPPPPTLQTIPKGRVG